MLEPGRAEATLTICAKTWALTGFVIGLSKKWENLNAAFAFLFPQYTFECQAPYA